MNEHTINSIYFFIVLFIFTSLISLLWVHLIDKNKDYDENDSDGFLN